MESQVESQTVPSCNAKGTRKNCKIRILVLIVAAVLLVAASVFTYKMTMGSQTASSKAVKVVQSNQKQDAGNKNDVTGTSGVVDKSPENSSNGSTQPSKNGTTSGVVTPKNTNGAVTDNTSGNVTLKNANGTTTNTTSGNVTPGSANRTVTNTNSGNVTPNNTNGTNTASNVSTPKNTNGTNNNSNSSVVTPENTNNSTITSDKTVVDNDKGDTGNNDVNNTTGNTEVPPAQPNQQDQTDIDTPNGDDKTEDDGNIGAEIRETIIDPKERIFLLFSKKFYSVAADGSEIKCYIEKPLSDKEIMTFTESATDPPIFAYSLYKDKKLYVLDTKNGRIKSIEFEHEECRYNPSFSRLALSPDGKYVAVSTSKRELFFIDVSEQKVLWSKKFDNWISDIKFSADGTDFFLLTKGELFVFSSDNYQNETKVGDISHQKLSPDGKKTCNVEYGNLIIDSLDPEIESFEFEFKHKKVGFYSWSRDGSKIFLQSAVGRDLVFIEFSLKTKTFAYITHKNNIPISFGDIEKTKCGSSVSSKKSIDTSGDDPNPSSSSEPVKKGSTSSKERIYFTPVFDNNYGKICSVAVDGTDYKCHVEGLTNHKIYIRALSKTDPAVLFYTTEGKLFSLNVSSNEIKKIAYEYGWPEYFTSISPDQTRLAFSGKDEIKVIDIEKDGEPIWESPCADITDVQFTPDGEQILILTDVVHPKVMKINASDGSGLAPFASIGFGTSEGKLCPDGKTFVSISNYRDIYVSRFENGNTDQFQKNEDIQLGDANLLSWSADYTKIYISVYIGPDVHLYEYSLPENKAKLIKNEKGEPVSLA